MGGPSAAMRQSVSDVYVVSPTASQASKLDRWPDYPIAGGLTTAKAGPQGKVTARNV